MKDCPFTIIDYEKQWNIYYGTNCIMYILKDTVYFHGKKSVLGRDSYDYKSSEVIRDFRFSDYNDYNFDPFLQLNNGIWYVIYNEQNGDFFSDGIAIKRTNLTYLLLLTEYFPLDISMRINNFIKEDITDTIEIGYLYSGAYKINISPSRNFFYVNIYTIHYTNKLLFYSLITFKEIKIPYKIYETNMNIKYLKEEERLYITYNHELYERDESGLIIYDTLAPALKTYYSEDDIKYLSNNPYGEERPIIEYKLKYCNDTHQFIIEIYQNKDYLDIYGT
jgi:hypothetical protein